MLRGQKLRVAADGRDKVVGSRIFRLLGKFKTNLRVDRTVCNDAVRDDSRSGAQVHVDHGMVLQGCLLEILRKTVECRHNREQTVLQIFAVTVQCNMMILAVKKGNIQFLLQMTDCL